VGKPRVVEEQMELLTLPTLFSTLEVLAAQEVLEMLVTASLAVVELLFLH
jgi:hypothetical protein